MSTPRAHATTKKCQMIPNRWTERKHSHPAGGSHGPARSSAGPTPDSARPVPRRRARSATLALVLGALAVLRGPPASSQEDPARLLQQLLGGGDQGFDEGAARRMVQERTGAVSRISGLPVLRPVDVRVLGRDEAVAWIGRRVEADVAPEVLAGLEAVYRGLGLLGEGTSLGAAYKDFARSQVAAFYDPVEGVLCLIRDIPVALQEPVVVHELVHALQDQNHALRGRIQAVDGDEDRSLALSALLEGQATWVMIREMLDRLGGGLGGAVDLSTVFGGGMDGLMSMAAAPGTVVPESVPPFLVQQMLFPYFQGAKWVDARVGSDPALEAAWRDVPRTTEQVLHPERRSEGEGGARIDDRAVEAALGPRRFVPFRTTLGEWNARIWLESRGGGGGGHDKNVAVARGAEGWGADRAYVVRHAGGDEALLWVTRWDSLDDAAEFVAASAPALGCAGIPAGDRWTCQGAAGARAGEAVVLAFGPEAGAPVLLEAGLAGVRGR